MNPKIIIRDVSNANHQPKKVFSTNIEINKTGHHLYNPSGTYTKNGLVKRFGEDIGTLMYFLLTFPMMDSIYITSYEICVALKRTVDVKDWSPTINKMIELSIKSLAEKQYKDSVVIQIQFGSNYQESRWFTDTSENKLTGNSHQRFWRPIRSMSQKYLRKLGKPWTMVIPSILKIPGVEEIETLGNTFKIEIASTFVPDWEIIERNILTILSGAFHQDVVFEYKNSDIKQ